MNLRTNFKVKIKKLKGKTLVSVPKWFTIRYSENFKKFLTLPPENYLKKIKFDKGITCDLTVYYCSAKEKNEGIYDNQWELLNAFSCFVEKDLLKEYWDNVLHPKRVVKNLDLEHLKRMRNKKRVKVPPQKKSLKLVKNLGSKK